MEKNGKVKSAMYLISKLSSGRTLGEHFNTEGIQTMEHFVSVIFRTTINTWYWIPFFFYFLYRQKVEMHWTNVFDKWMLNTNTSNPAESYKNNTIHLNTIVNRSYTNVIGLHIFLNKKYDNTTQNTVLIEWFHHGGCWVFNVITHLLGNMS